MFKYRISLHQKLVQPAFSTHSLWRLDLQVMLAHLFGLFGLLPLLIFPLLGLVCLVLSFFLLRAAVVWGLYGPSGWSLRWLEVDPSIGCPIRIFAGGVTGGEWQRGVVRWVDILSLQLQKRHSVKDTYLELLSLCHWASPSEEASLGSACSAACQHTDKNHRYRYDW